MRKNKVDRKKLNFFYVYEISGLNTDNLVNILKNKGINLADVKKRDRKTLLIAVNYADNEKFFAITRNLCYNIRKIGEKGKLRLLVKIFRNFGLLIGALAFTLLSVFFDDIILSVEYRGADSAYTKEIAAYLKSENIGKFSRFSGLDLATLSDKILAATGGVSFAECSKMGNRLVIELAPKTEQPKVLGGDRISLVSDIDGEIEFIKVYRGRALKKVGDTVKVGEVICDGFDTVKDNLVKVGVIATVSVKAEYNYTYESEKDGEEDIAAVFAEIAFGDGDIIGSAVEKVEKQNGTYEYKVKILYRRLLYG